MRGNSSAKTYSNDRVLVWECRLNICRVHSTDEIVLEFGTNTSKQISYELFVENSNLFLPQLTLQVWWEYLRLHNKYKQNPATKMNKKIKKNSLLLLVHYFTSTTTLMIGRTWSMCEEETNRRQELSAQKRWKEAATSHKKVNISS